VRPDRLYVFAKAPEAEAMAAPARELLALYPNPSPGMASSATVRFDGMADGVLVVHSLLGSTVRRIIITGASEGGTAVVALGPLHSGTYIVTWKSGNTSATKLLHVVQ
jgi:hypothetical protein